MADAPWLLLFPYLPLSGGVDVGRWTLLPVKDFVGPWCSPGFRQRSLAVIRRHVDRSGRPLERPSLLTDRDAGADGVLPEPHEVDALHLALGFGVVDAAPVWRSDAEIAAVAAHRASQRDRDPETFCRELEEENEDGQYATWRVGTADNAEPYFWPVHTTGGIARQYGTLVSTTVAGSGPGLAGKVIPPNELHLPGRLSLDQDRVGAVYTVLAQAPSDPDARKLRESVRWLLQAWRNTPSLLPAQRVVLLRTAFEVLLGDPGIQLSKEKLARRLASRFEALPVEEQARIDPGDTLWQPGEPRDLQLSYVSQSLGPYSDLERWFIGLSAARNKIVHEGHLDYVSDETPGSSYAGEYWRTATRVLRDLILVDLDRRGYPGLWDDALGRAIWRSLEACHSEE